MAFSDLAISGGGAAASPGQNGSSRGQWFVAVDNAKTVASSPLQPTSLTTNSALFPVGDNGTRLLLRLRTVEDADVTTAPIVYVYGLFGDGKDLDSYIVARVDNADQNATGITVPAIVFDGTAGILQTIGSVVYAYGDIVSLDGVDMKGASYGMVVIATAAVEGTDPSEPVQIEGLVIS